MSRGRAGEVAPALFDPAAYRCVPTAGRRLREMAAARPPRRSPPATRREENTALMERLRGIGAELAAAFRLRHATIEAEQDGVVGHYGVCYRDGVIRIRLRHATTDRPLKESSLVDTLCHELAHLRHFDHSPRFRRFYFRILEEARRRGHYRPGPDDDARRRRPRSLFEDAACGTVLSSPPRGDRSPS